MSTYKLNLQCMESMNQGCFEKGVYHLEELFELDTEKQSIFLRVKSTGERFLISHSCVLLTSF